MNDMITIPKAEYDRLVESAEDLSDIQDARTAIEGGRESFPSAIVSRLIDGESPVAVFRDMRGLSQSELSRRSGVNRVQIVDIEKGRSTGSVDTLKKLADALGLTVDDLI